MTLAVSLKQWLACVGVTSLALSIYVFLDDKLGLERRSHLARWYDAARWKENVVPFFAAAPSVYLDRVRYTGNTYAEHASGHATVLHVAFIIEPQQGYFLRPCHGYLQK